MPDSFWDSPGVNLTCSFGVKPEVAQRALALTPGPSPGQTTRGIAPIAMTHIGISTTSVQCIWNTHRLRPLRLRQIKPANNPNLAAKLRAIVGVYIE